MLKHHRDIVEKELDRLTLVRVCLWSQVSIDTSENCDNLRCALGAVAVSPHPRGLGRGKEPIGERWQTSSRAARPSL